MIQLAVLNDRIVDGQRRAAGKKLRRLLVVAVDRFNVVIAGAVGDNPLQGRSFFANFRHLVHALTPEEVTIITPQLRKYFNALYGVDLAGKSLVEMDEALHLGGRDKGGALALYLKIKVQGNEDDDDGEELSEDDA